MPFTVSPGTYQPQLAMAGFASLGKGIGDILSDVQDTQSKLGGSDLIVSHAYRNGQITHDELNKYMNMSGKQKLQFSGAIASNMANDLQAAQIAHFAAQTELAKAQASELGPFTPGLRQFNLGGTPVDVGLGGDESAAAPPVDLSANAPISALAGGVAPTAPSLGDTGQVDLGLGGPMPSAGVAPGLSLGGPPQRSIVALQTGRHAFQIPGGQESQYVPGYGNVTPWVNPQTGKIEALIINGQLHVLSLGNPLLNALAEQMGINMGYGGGGAGGGTGGGTQQSPGLRQQAINILTQNRKQVTEGAIQDVISQLTKGGGQ